MNIEARDTVTQNSAYPESGARTLVVRLRNCIWRGEMRNMNRLATGAEVPKRS